VGLKLEVIGFSYKARLSKIKASLTRGDSRIFVGMEKTKQPSEQEE